MSRTIALIALLAPYVLMVTVTLECTVDQAERNAVCGRQGNGGDDPTGDDGGVCLAGYTAPVTRSPLDPWHSEQYLLGCLVKMHGWYWLRPRVLAGPWRRARVHSFMHPEGE